MVRKAQDPARKNGVNDQPDRRQGDDDIGDDRADRTVAHEDGGNKVEIKDPVQPPVHGAEQNQNVRYKVRNDHTITSCP